MRFCTLVAGVALLAGTLCAQMPAAPDFRVDAETRAKVIDELLTRLEEEYVFPDVANAMATAVRHRTQRNEYEALNSAAEFAAKLTADLQAVSKDKHLRVRHTARGADEAGKRPLGPLEQQKRDDYAFHRIDRLPGNIGYIDLRLFFAPEVAGDKAAEAMKSVAGTDALIIDLRENGGGHPGMVALLTSYLMGDEPVHLNDFVGRDGNVQRSYWTLKDVPGPRYEKDVYVLTSSKTFSAAEEFAYNLLNLKRATLIGETTGGGANPIDMFKLDGGFAAGIPGARARNPITGTNWEGVGVKPHVDVPARVALATAHLSALEKLAQQGGGDASVLEAARKELEAAKKS